jgi:hypothetical protein
MEGKPDGKGPVGGPTRRCVDNIKMDLGQVGKGGMDWFMIGTDGGFL